MTQELEIRFCREDDVPAILQLQETIFAALGDAADLLRRNTEETFRRCLAAPNFTLGVYDGAHLAGLSIMEDARGRADDLGIQLENHVLSGDYADFKLVMIEPAYRGRGLQKDLMRITEEIAYRQGYRWFCTSVSPENAYSRANIRAAGFTLDCEKELYGGLRREIYVKKLGEKRTIREILQNKRVLLWGHGLEGKSAENFIRAHCAVQSLSIHEGPQDAIDEDAYDVIIKSPGIREEHWNEKYTSVTELFLSAFAEQTVGITGTKGKSTTASLLYEVLSACQTRPVVLVGNIGIPCLDAYEEIREDTIIVFELSCHQLDHLQISPHVAVFLNLYEEHLDHYDTLARYFAAKTNITTHQTADDFFFAGENVPPIRTRAKTEILPFAEGRAAGTGSGGPAAGTGDAAAGSGIPMQLAGAHNQFNARVVLQIATTLFGCEEDAVKKVIGQFRGLRHRMEYLGEKDGVFYYDDSISTIPEAAIAALGSVPQAKTILLGGMDRGIHYDVLVQFIREHPAYQYIFMYEAGKRIYDQVADLSCCAYREDLTAAVALAKEITPAGCACLLSPAAASYGYFKNFEERGDVFRDLVFRN